MQQLIFEEISRWREDWALVRIAEMPARADRIRENPLQIFQFGQVVVDDVGTIGIVLEVVLMVALAG